MDRSYSPQVAGNAADLAGAMRLQDPLLKLRLQKSKESVDE